MVYFNCDKTVEIGDRVENLISGAVFTVAAIDTSDDSVQRKFDGAWFDISEIGYIGDSDV